MKHGCPFCPRSFKTPQALGGHKPHCPNAKKYILIIDDDHQIGTKDQIETAIKVAKEVDNVDLKDVVVHELGPRMKVGIQTSVKAYLTKGG
jgi:hypothetical protein